MKCVDVVKEAMQEVGAREGEVFYQSVANLLWWPLMGKPKEENIYKL